jgi:hypothetical protein
LVCEAGNKSNNGSLEGSIFEGEHAIKITEANKKAPNPRLRQFNIWPFI